jgi:tRNA (cmo5U34)-methyltransferase
MNADRVALGYDRLAAGYDLLARAVYGNALRRAQSCFLGDIGANDCVLVLGGGSGWFLEALLRQAQPRHVVYVELSAQMLARAQHRIRQNMPEACARVDFVHGRAEDALPDGSFDVVVTHCLLDMYDDADLPALVCHLMGCLRPGGHWYFSDFAVPPSWPMRGVAQALLWVMYRFFRLVCKIDARRLPDFGSAFASAGLEKLQGRAFFGGMIVAGWYRVAAR